MSSKKDSIPYSKLGTQRLPLRLTDEVIFKFYEALDCPRSLMAAILFREKDYDQLVGLEADPLDYDCSSRFRDAHLASSFLSKSKFLATSFDKKELALQKFKTFEALCAETNARFSESSVPINEMSGNGALLAVMRRKITKILGEFDPLELFELASWGPGVSTLLKGEETFAAKKFQQEVGITRDLYPLVKDMFPLTYPLWWSRLVERPDFPSFQVGNAIVTVPKTSKIDRVIAIEPGLNLWLQLGVGSMIKRRMGRAGVDLTTQTHNQRACRLGSISNKLATVDMSSASDSIATELVRNLFSSSVRENAAPSSGTFRWFEVMDLIRSKYGSIAGKTFRWNKFSSMGNGFTWDLESLIFYTAACACCESIGVSTAEVKVFGDDIILPSICYDSFCSLCEFLGFKVNPKKSFFDGPFRESCGAHYYEGVDCKPLYLEDLLSVPDRVYNFANTLRIRSHSSMMCDTRFRSLFYKLVHSVPSKIRFRVPAIWNEESREVEPLQGGFISNYDEACPPRAPHGIEGYLVRHLAWVPVSVEVDYFGLLLARMVGLPKKEREQLDLMAKVRNQSPGNENPLRGRVKCVLLSGRNATLVRQWYNLGPWL